MSEEAKIETPFYDPDPITMPVLALRGLTVFPHMSMSLDVEREVSLRALEKAMEGDQRIFLVTQREIGTEAPEERDLYEVGTVCAIRQILKMSGSTARSAGQKSSRRASSAVNQPSSACTPSRTYRGRAPSSGAV